jgi:hypothetical protein
MIRSWVVRLELARDDDGPLGDDGIRRLTELLTENHVLPVLTRGDPGTVVVQMTVDATSDTAARSAAERALRDRAQELWTALGLPPFTITFVDANQAAKPIG